MATIKRKGYGQVELTQVAFRRDGRIEAQLPFAGDAGDTCENGMILAVDKANGKVEYAGTTVAGKLYGIVYTSEELYDTRTPGLRNFALTVNADGEVVGPEGYNVYPRIGYLAKGDRFITNAIEGADTTAGATVEVGNYGKAGADGFIAIATAAATAGPVLQVVEITTMPDGQDGVKFIVIDD